MVGKKESTNMKYTILPNTDIKISKICLGTMTFGEQNTESEAHEQLDYALDHDVNFIDTAEMYAVPGCAETQGSTERYIGSWLHNRKNRDKVVLATKVAGPNPSMDYIRKNLGFSKDAIYDAIEKSLVRLQTDYIDLYQLHWPDRNVNFFGQRGYKHSDNEQWNDNILSVINILNDLIKEGKIRHYGLSNETPWGVMRHIDEATKNRLSLVKTIQNPYSLLNRTYEVGLAEISMRENIGLLAYSPMAFGILSGKYLQGKKPKGARMSLFPQMSRYLSSQVEYAVKKYADLAIKNNLSLAQMSLAFVNQQDFVTSNIIGATSLSQLKENIQSIDIKLSDEILKEIDIIQEIQPNPAP
jgi:aryl-alcohol dehydrogenase-like predicted oxidoreductase